MRAFEERQKNSTALPNLAHAKFILLRMNPVAGLGNRMVALVSGFLLSLITEVMPCQRITTSRCRANIPLVSRGLLSFTHCFTACAAGGVGGLRHRTHASQWRGCSAAHCSKPDATAIQTSLSRSNSSPPSHSGGPLYRFPAQVSTMSPLRLFIAPPFPCDAADILSSPQVPASTERPLPWQL